MEVGKKQYEKPAMQVYELKRQSGLLVGSLESRSAAMDVTYEEEDI